MLRFVSAINTPTLTIRLVVGWLSVCMSGAVSAQAVQFSGNGNHYEFVSAPSVSWNNANTAAAARRFGGVAGHLATVTTVEENNFLNANFNLNTASQFAWLGGHEPAGDNNWLWAVGPEAGTQFSSGQTPTTPFNFANWSGIEPNNSGSNFLALNIGTTFAGTIVPGGWADAEDVPTPSEPIVGYIVEYETGKVFAVTLPLSIAGLDFVAQDTRLKASNPTTMAALQRAGIDRQLRLVRREILYRERRDERRLSTEANNGATVRKGVAAGEGESSTINLWVNTSRSWFSDSAMATAFEADVSSLLIGIDSSIQNDVLIGAMLGYERQDVDTYFNLGVQEIDHYQVAAYAAYLVTDQISVDGVAGYTDIGIDQERIQPIIGLVGSDVDGARWYLAGNVTAHFEIGNVFVDVSTGLLYARDKFDRFTESNGLANASSKSTLSQWQIGAQLGYLVRDFELFGTLFHVYDLERTEVSVGPDQIQPRTDRTEVQMGAGIRYLGSENLTASFEYVTVKDRENFDSEVVQLNVQFTF